MDWTHWHDVLKNGLIWLFSNTIVIGVFSWIANKYYEKSLRIMKEAQEIKMEEIKKQNTISIDALKAGQSQQLEAVKSQLSDISTRLKAEVDRGSLAFKTHFDLEFKSYVDLWSLLDESMIHTTRIPRYLNMDYSEAKSKKEKREIALTAYDEVRINSDKIRKLKPFIESNIASLAIGISADCLQECSQFHYYFINDAFSNEAWSQERAMKETVPKIDSILRRSDDLANLIHKRIKGIYIIA